MSKAAKLPDTDTRQTYVFEQPIKRGNTKIPEVQVRTPNSGELRGLSLTAILNMEVDSLRVLLPRITAPALTTNEIDELMPADLVGLGGKIAGFFVPKAEKDSLTA